ncbi:MAG: cysteine--tRNA ligase [Oscillospiraceae bacterium]|jgi:cysteinyl-tRNA synthetase|nr:cysteine--tRNA ligase [Oscillospiraceae bacterium]
MLRFYNTLSRSKEEFAPLESGEVSIYSCGPTVYNYAHIGNLRAYIFMDLLRRVLKWNGYSLKHAMNITDVGHLVSDGDEGEDKMAKTAREQKKTPYEVAEHYTGVFLKDIERLNIDKPELIVKATDNIPEMIKFVEELCEKGYGYEISDGVYFDISRLPSYGRLSRANLEEQQAGARVEVNGEKRNPLDFALIKKAPKEHIMQWDSPWGRIYPGWHIECSAIGLKYLGEEFDVHTGGVDHIPIHHENEIAQTEALLGHPAARTWMHSEFLLVDGGKMSKSLGNTYTIDTLIEKGYSPLDYRYFCLNAHYRNKLNFTFEGLDGAKKSLENLRAAVLAHKGKEGEVDAGTLDGFEADFEDAVNDDLNIPKALGGLWNMARHGVKSDKIYRLIMELDRVFALDLGRQPREEAAPELDGEVAALIEARQTARKEKNFAEADRIRDKLKEMGIVLTDTPDGVRWSRG